ncbi:MAG: phosphoglycerate kinase [Candidatus Staskawiczbacteria bacterium]|nr:phosphoglycerate kinase [Candidatus Staskawiczbacteria bacterium]
MKTIKDFDVEGKRILVRCDFNVPLDEDGNICDDFRIVKTLPTIEYLVEQKAKIILMSHLGEPEGRIIPALNLNKIKEKLEELLNMDIVKADDCIGPKVQQQVENLEPGEILLLENLRFHKEETENDSDFAEKLAQLGDFYINDAFADCHRTHASIALIPQFLPGGAGLLLEEEISVLSKIMQQPDRPMVAIIGGSKASTKAPLVDPFCAFADLVIVNGLIKQELIAQKIPLQYPEKVLGPKDNLERLDVNEQDVLRFTSPILKAKTIFWNGPFGKFEDEQYKNGTLQIAKAIIESKAFSVVGGGETIEFLDKEGMLDQFSHVSTGGGAMLDFISGQTLPGLEALN